MDLALRAVRVLSTLGGLCAAALIAASVGVVCQMVVVRYVLGQTTIWQTDFVTFALVAATFLGGPYVLMTRGHVNVDVLPLHVGPAARLRLALAAGALAGASLLERTAPPARPDAADVVQPAPSETSPLGQAGRIAALEAARRLAASRMAESAPRVPRPGAVEEVAMDPASTARPSAAAPAPEPADLAECGLGSAEIGCR